MSSGERLQAIALALLAGVLATIAALRSPILGGVPPIVLPYVPIDLRLLLLPALFAGTEAMAPFLGWPGRAVATLGAAVFSGLLAHLHVSAALSFAGTPWAVSGTRIDLVGFGATLGSVLSALAITLETARGSVREEAIDRGIPEDELGLVDELGGHVMQAALTTSGLAIAVLAITVRIADTFLAGGSVPLAGLAALALVLALGAVLVGIQGREDLPA